MGSKLNYNPVSIDMTSAEIEAISALLTLATNAGGRLGMRLSGRTVNNLLGTIGACEAVAGVWSLLGSLTMADDATTKKSGTNSTRATCASANSSEQLANPIARFDLTKYYLYTMWVKNNNLGGGLRLYFQTNGTGKVLVVSSFSTSTSWTRIGIVVQPSNYGTGSTEVELGLNTTGATAGQYGNIDEIMVNEISATEYALGATALMALYPYHDGVKSTDKQTIVSTNGTLSTTATSPVELKSVGTGANQSDVYVINSGLHTKNVSDWVTLSGNAFSSWNISADKAGFKIFGCTAPTGVMTDFTLSKATVIKYNGKNLTQQNAFVALTGADIFGLGNGYSGQFPDTDLVFGLADADTGFPELWTESEVFTGLAWAGLIKAYMNGWKLTTANVDVASCVWTGITSGTVKNAGAADYTHVQANIDVGFTPYQMIYQLATPIETQYNPQILSAYPSGTVTLTPETAGSSTVPTVTYSDDTNLSARVTSLEEEIALLDTKVSTRTTWSPTVTWGTADPTGSVAQVARYHKIGNMVFINYSYTATDGNDASSLTITLPFTPKDNNSVIALSAQQKVDTTWTNPLAYIDDDSGGVAFRALSVCTNAAAVEIIVSGYYEIA